MWEILLPILTGIFGVGVGGFGSYHLFKKQMTSMQNDPKQIQALAKSMGMNLNQKQMNQITRSLGNKPANQKKKSKNKKR